MTDRRGRRAGRSREAAAADPRSLPRTSDDDVPTVVFVCTGNICRSPMAEVIARAHALDEGVRARFASAGVSDEEHGNPIDPRAVRQLRSAGYTPGRHVAHRITDDELAEADLIIGLEESHVRALRRRAPTADVRLLTEFDPAAPPGEGVPDPWYGAQEGFARTARAIEAAVPGLLAHLRQRAESDAEPEATA